MMKTFAELINANEVIFAKNLHQLVKLEEATLNSARKVKLFVKKHTHTQMTAIEIIVSSSKKTLT